MHVGSFHVKCGIHCLQCMNYCYFVLNQNPVMWFVFFDYRHESPFFHINFKIMKKIFYYDLGVNKADTP